MNEGWKEITLNVAKSEFQGDLLELQEVHCWRPPSPSDSSQTSPSILPCVELGSSKSHSGYSLCPEYIP